MSDATRPATTEELRAHIGAALPALRAQHPIRSIGVFGFWARGLLTDTMRQKAVIPDFEVLGEAATRVPPDIRKLAEDIPWRRIVAMRNELIHGYFLVDLAIVFSTAKSDIPKLRLPLETLRARLDADD